jgi:hypothetical protein
MVAIALAAVSVGPPASADARAKLRVSVTPAAAPAGDNVRVVVRGATRARCSLVLRAGSRVALRRRIARRSRFTIPAGAPGRRTVTVTCGGRSGRARLTVTPPPAPVAPPAASPPPAVPLPAPVPARPCPLTEAQLEPIFGVALPRIADLPPTNPALCSFSAFRPDTDLLSQPVLDVYPFPREGQPQTAAAVYDKLVAEGQHVVPKPEWGAEAFATSQVLGSITWISLFIGALQVDVLLPLSSGRDPDEVAQRVGDLVAASGLAPLLVDT